MLDLKNYILPESEGSGQAGRFHRFYGIMRPKMASYLRLLSTKNAVNRSSDYHHLVLPVTGSTEAVNGIDYIHPVVTPAVDYATAVITRSLLPGGELDFEFPAADSTDILASRQATEMVWSCLNSMNSAYDVMHSWVQDAVLHKNGLVLVSPVRERFTNYKTITGTLDELRAWEISAEERGLTVVRQRRRKIDVNLEAAAEQTLMLSQQQQFQDSAEADAAITDALDANTIYRAEYKLLGWDTKIRIRPIAQHYWICDPTVETIEDQPFCGFYDPMTIQEAMERYPGIDLEEFERYAEYSNIGAYQAGSLLNNLALHARDSVPVNGLPTTGTASIESEARQITVITVWDRYDIDGDGELELIEMVYSGRYIISAKEVEFIPVANMCPKPLTQNFYGFSIAERMVPMQEYATAIHRAELQMAMYASTPRIGVNPEFVDLEQLQDGESSIFVLDRKFDPTVHVWEPQPLQGNLGYVTDALARLQQDMGAMLGMTTPQDVFNPEVMSPGNSGLKLQLALGPNQLIQEDTVRAAATGVKELIYLTWRTLLQYGDDYSIRRLAQRSSADTTGESGAAEFLDWSRRQDLEFTDRRDISVSLALGMLSDENRLQRQALIIQTQQGFAGAVQAMMASGLATPELIAKSRLPYEDSLYVLGIKNPDQYLPTDEEILTAMQAKAESAAAAPPTADEQAKQARAQLDQARALEIQADVTGESAERQLEAVALLQKGSAVNY